MRFWYCEGTGMLAGVESNCEQHQVSVEDHL